MGRYNRRIDNNQRDIVKALRDIPGVSVAVNHDDIFVGYRGKNYWFEVKSYDAVSSITGEVQPSKLKKSQVDIHEKWTGQYDIVWTVEQIIKIITCR